MARVTVEDCLEHLDNRFQLVLVGSKRARQLAAGAPSRLGWENDKPTVLALREIAAGLVDASVLDESAARIRKNAGISETEVREELSQEIDEE